MIFLEVGCRRTACRQSRVCLSKAITTNNRNEGKMHCANAECFSRPTRLAGRISLAHAIRSASRSIRPRATTLAFQCARYRLSTFGFVPTVASDSLSSPLEPRPVLVLVRRQPGLRGSTIKRTEDADTSIPFSVHAFFTD